MDPARPELWLRRSRAVETHGLHGRRTVAAAQGRAEPRVTVTR